MRFGTALSIPSVFTAVTNCWCSSADHTTRGFFNADESSWPSSFGSVFPFKLLPGGNSTPVASSSRADVLRARFFPVSSPAPFERPGLPSARAAARPFRVTGFPFPEDVFLCAPREPSSDPSDAASASPDPALAPSAPPSPRFLRTTCCQMLRSSSMRTGLSR